MSLLRRFLVVFLVPGALCKAIEKRDLPVFGQAKTPLNELQISLDNGKNITLKDVFVNGVKKLVFQNFKYDLKKHSVLLSMEAALDVQAVIEEKYNVQSGPSIDMSLIKPCSRNDIKCLTYTAQYFLKEASGGYPALNIKPIDPMHIASIEVDLETEKKATLKDVSVTGLKKLIISNFEIDTTTKSVVLGITVNPEIQANIEVDGKKSGTLSLIGKATSIAEFNYDLLRNAEGVEYFSLGIASITCNPQAIAEIKLDSAADELLLKGQPYPEHNKEIVLCTVIKPAFRTIIQDLKETTKVYPKTSYFTDL